MPEYYDIVTKTLVFILFSYTFHIYEIGKILNYLYCTYRLGENQLYNTNREFYLKENV